MALHEFKAALSDGYLYEFKAENFIVTHDVLRAYDNDADVFAAPTSKIISIVRDDVKVSLR
ncbi:MAG: hypothetical protein AB7I38_18060 [Dehalococcoidia bacterium]